MIVLFIASSLDGFIAKKNGDVSWLFHDRDYGYIKFMQSIDTVIMGRKTYDFGVKFSNPPFPGKKNIIITTRKALHKTSAGRIIFCSLNRAHKIIRENKPPKDIWLVGGTELITDFINKKLLNKIIMSVHPILLGTGIPLFENINKMINLTLVASKSFSNGLVQLEYALNYNQKKF